MRRFAAILAVLSWVIIGCVDEAKKAKDCTDDQIKCDGTCIDPNTNMDYCGATASCLGDDKGSRCAANQTCNAGKCVDKGSVCTVNVCSDGKIQVCANGNLGAAVNCAGGASCKSASECGECKDGILECSDTKIKICENGVWKENADCKTDNKICVAGACTEAASCETSLCADGKIQVCGEDNKLQSEKICDGGASCKSVSECGECKDGILECNDTKVEICENGIWKEDADCKTDNKVCAGGVCIEAASCDKSICAEGKIQVCGEDHKLQSEKICDSGFSCKSASECGECKEDAFACTETGYKLCIGGQWGTETCTDNKVCDPVAKNCVAVPECEEDVFECTETGYRICVTGTWMTETCKDGKVCDLSAGNCVAVPECEEDAFECTETGYRICVTGTWLSDTCLAGSVCDSAAGDCVWVYSIDYAKTLGYNATTTVMWGEVYSGDSPASMSSTPPAELLSQIVCTTDETIALASWTVAADASYTGLHTGIGGNNYEFSGEIVTDIWDRYCLMRFSGDNGTTWHYALSDGSVLLGKSDTLSSSDQALLVPGVGAGYEMFEDFEKVTLTATYVPATPVAITYPTAITNGKPQTMTIYGSNAGYTEAIPPKANGERSVALRDTSSITVTGLDAGLGTISFLCWDWTGAYSADFDIMVNGIRFRSVSIFSTCGTTTPKTVTITVNLPSATSFAIQAKGSLGQNMYRFVVDNLRWDSYK